MIGMRSSTWLHQGSGTPPTADSSCRNNGDAILQVLFNKWCTIVQEELADLFGMERPPEPSFKTKDKRVTALVKQNTGSLDR